MVDFAEFPTALKQVTDINEYLDLMEFTLNKVETDIALGGAIISISSICTVSGRNT